MRSPWDAALADPPRWLIKVLEEQPARPPISDTTGVDVASGTQFSGHADFFNAWDERVLARIVNSCFHDHPCDPKKL